MYTMIVIGHGILAVCRHADIIAIDAVDSGLFVFDENTIRAKVADAQTLDDIFCRMKDQAGRRAAGIDAVNVNLRTVRIGVLDIFGL